VVALALTSGCLRFGYAATNSDPKPDASQRDAGAPSRDGGTRDGGTRDGGTRDGGTRDAAVSSNAGMDGGAARTDAASAGSATDAAAGGAGAYAAADSGAANAGTAAEDADAGVDVIDVNQMIGDTGLRVNDVLGFYSSPTWGDMLIQAHGAEIWATYPLNDGTIIGEITSEGVLAGWWTETPSRVGGNAGEVEFRWSHVSGTIHFEGQWRYQTSGNWYDNWDLDLVTDRSPPSALIDAFNYPDNFKHHP
jgi:hypothetical protein